MTKVKILFMDIEVELEDDKTPFDDITGTCVSIIERLVPERIKIHQMIPEPDAEDMQGQKPNDKKSEINPDIPIISMHG